jgi:acetoin utilization deacetylase AcuC-like enzyme
VKIFYDHRYNTTGLTFDTVRKADCIRRSLEERPIAGVEIASPSPVSWDDLELVHSPEYLLALRTGEPVHVAAGAGIGWDELYSIAIRWSTGGLCDAVREALETSGIAGSLSSGLHHAHRDHGLGFCSVNGLALAAVLAVERGARRVLILDLDAHCGGGTAEIISAWPQIEQVDVSVVKYDFYPSRDDARSYLMYDVRDGEHYLEVVRRALAEIDDPSSIDLVIYNAGMDPHGEAGGVPEIDTETLRRREEMVFAWARGFGLPIAWTVAGGYSDADDMGPVVDLHRLTIEAAVAHTDPPSAITPSLA